MTNKHDDTEALQECNDHLISAFEALDGVMDDNLQQTIRLPLDRTIAIVEDTLAIRSGVAPSRICSPSPDYYKAGGLEAIDVIEAYCLGFHLGNVIKYILRAGHKSDTPLTDLRKARWYLERYISQLEARS